MEYTQSRGDGIAPSLLVFCDLRHTCYGSIPIELP
jgi:hypothetical protein